MKSTCDSQSEICAASKQIALPPGSRFPGSQCEFAEVISFLAAVYDIDRARDRSKRKKHGR